MKKAIHISIIIVIIVAIIFTALILILRYDEKGETNMPFSITKISVISTADGEDIEDDENLWNKQVGQDNDIYLYIEKNEGYKKVTTIKSIVLNNFEIVQRPKKGEITIYSPSQNKNIIFENEDEYKANEIIFFGEQETDIKNLQVSNQGGIVAFRAAIQKLGTYISNDEELEHKDLLKKIGINGEDIQSKISFDINILLDDGKVFKANVEVQIPTENVVEEGKSSREDTKLNIVFKREEN